MSDQYEHLAVGLAAWIPMAHAADVETTTRVNAMTQACRGLHHASREIQRLRAVLETLARSNGDPSGRMQIIAQRALDGEGA